MSKISGNLHTRLELRRAFSKVAGYKIDTQKSSLSAVVVNNLKMILRKQFHLQLPQRKPQ